MKLEPHENGLRVVNTRRLELSDGTVIPAGAVVGYTWRGPNRYWQATTAEDTGRQIIRVRTCGYRRDYGYITSEDAKAAIIDFVTKGQGAP